jgi:hypothetical protein
MTAISLILLLERGCIHETDFSMLFGLFGVEGLAAGKNIIAIQMPFGYQPKFFELLKERNEA